MSKRKMDKQISERINHAKLDLLIRLHATDPDSPAFQQLLSQFNELIKIDTTPPRRRVSPDTIALIVANLLGILIIVGYEAGHVFVSKAQNHLIKPT